MDTPPIHIREDEGHDDLRPGSDNTGELARLNVPEIPLYHLGSAETSLTAPRLYPRGVGDPSHIGVFSHLNDPLERADSSLSRGRNGEGLAVASGFLSPANQHERYLALYGSKTPSTPWEEIQASRYADSAGSIANPRENDVYRAKLAELLADHKLIEELQSESGQKDVSPLIKELLSARINAGLIEGGEVDISTANSIHNLAHSANVALTADGRPVNMGVGIDTPSPVQAVNYFEYATPEGYEKLVVEDPLLAAYLESHGVTEISENLLLNIRENRRRLFHALREEGFDFYRGEQGHFSMPRKTGNHPSRDYVYEKALRMGYKIQ